MAPVRDALRAATLCGSLLFVASCDRGESPVAPSPLSGVAATSAQGRIAFSSNRDGAYGIYVMNDDGTAVTRLTDDSDYAPAWSPDGTRLAFISQRDGNNELYVMNADGTGVTRLTNDPAWDLSPAWSPDGSRIAFASERDGNSEIYVMNADGSAVTRLTSNTTWDGEPAWSPDGTRLAFGSYRSGTVEIYVMNADGTGVVQLTTTWSTDPIWSPDGSRIAFKAFADTSEEIYVMNADGTGVTRLTNSAGTDENPVWSPDGSQLAFDSDRDGDFEIYVMNADGTGVTQLTSDSTNDLEPAWFAVSGPPPNQPPLATFTSTCSGLTCGFTSTSSDPDGSIVAYGWTFGDGGTSTATNPSHTYGSGGTYTVTLTVTDNQGATGSASTSVTVTPASVTGKIAFTSNRDGNSEIYVMNADGTGATRLTNNAAIDGDPAWSPDGTRLAFTSTRDGNYEIYVMNADGSGVTRLTNDPNQDRHPAWCGTRIAFQSDRYLPPFYDIYVMNDDGTGPTRLTISNASSDEYPAWSPSCSRIAYSYDPNSSAASINAMNADGSGNHTVISGAGQNNSPAISPDGTRMAFTSRRDSDQPPVPLEIREIYVLNADGSQTRVTHTDVNAWNVQPTWSPDGTQIAFQSNRDGSNAIYLINADGTNLTRLTSDSAGDAQPAWFAIANPPPNQPPVANFSSSCSGLTCSFYNMSSDPDGWIAAYSWTFGDSGTSTLRGPSHTYGSAGTYAVTLTLTDNQGATGSVSHTVSISPPPPPPPLPMHMADPDGSSASAGSSWSATVVVTVQDTNQVGVSGATVTGTWSLGGESSCTTDGSGACTVAFFGAKNHVHDVTFTVSGVTMAGGVYNPAANQDPDGDSNGTSITVSR